MNLIIRIKCFGEFLKLMYNYPTTPIENWQDMNISYYFQTNKEVLTLMKELEKIC